MWHTAQNEMNCSRSKGTMLFSTSIMGIFANSSVRIQGGVPECFINNLYTFTANRYYTGTVCACVFGCLLCVRWMFPISLPVFLQVSFFVLSLTFVPSECITFEVGLIFASARPESAINIAYIHTGIYYIDVHWYIDVQCSTLQVQLVTCSIYTVSELYRRVFIFRMIKVMISCTVVFLYENLQ